MNFLHICLFLCANFVAAEVSHYSKCYDEFSICLLTSIEDDPTTSDDKSKLTRSSAEEWCEVNSWKLAIIPNKTVESAMKKFINEYSAKFDSDVITNGNRKVENNWMWINGRLSAIYPSGNTYRYVCLYVSSDRSYSLSDGPSTSALKFVCSYLKNNSRCSDEYKLRGDACYKIHIEFATWFDARTICLKEGSDLAIFKDEKPSLPFQYTGYYWIGQRKESWHWRNGQKHVGFNYSNWDDWSPHAAGGGECLCLKARTGKWTDCNCSKNYRYVCIQEMSTTVSTNTTPSSSSAPTTTHYTLSVGDSTVQFHSTSTPMLDSNFRDEASGNPLHMPKPENFAMLLGLGIGSACLLIIIIVIVVVVCIKNRRSRSGDHEIHEPTHANSPPPMTYNKDDAPNAVYAVVVANDDEPVRSPSEKTPNQTVYAELDLEPKGKITRRSSQPVRYPSERNPDQSVYAEVDPIPRRKTLGRAAAVGQQESDVYANSLQVDSVYANNAQTKV